MKKIFFIALLAFFTITGMAQTEEFHAPREKQKWAVGGILTLLAPDFDYYNKNLERYNPPTQMVWFGSSWLNGGMMGDRQAQFHLRSGVFIMSFRVLQSRQHAKYLSFLYPIRSIIGKYDAPLELLRRGRCKQLSMQLGRSMAD